MYQDTAIIQARATRDIPPPGRPHGIALPGTQQPGRTPIYRNWRYVDGLLETIDPNVSFLAFYLAGIAFSILRLKERKKGTII